MARKKRHTEHADERWLLTYADMITLLMALFMVLFSMSVVNKGKFEELAKSLKASFAGPLNDGGQSVLEVGSKQPAVDTPRSQATDDPLVEKIQESKKHRVRAAVAARAQEERQDRSLQEAKRTIDAQVKALGLGNQVRTLVDKRGLVIRLVTDEVLFAPGSFEIRPGAHRLLTAVARAVDKVQRNPIKIGGHTDGVPYGGPLGNDGLSGMRASAVLGFMTTHGLDDHDHDVAGTLYGDREPLPGHPNHRDRPTPVNRRVEVLVERIQYTEIAQRQAEGTLGANPVGVPSISPDAVVIAPGARSHGADAPAATPRATAPAAAGAEPAGGEHAAAGGH